MEWAGPCRCQLPFGPGAIVDWSVQDFYTISMVEWLEIADEN